MESSSLSHGEIPDAALEILQAGIGLYKELHDFVSRSEPGHCSEETLGGVVDLNEYLEDPESLRVCSSELDGKEFCVQTTGYIDFSSYPQGLRTLQERLLFDHRDSGGMANLLIPDYLLGLKVHLAGMVSLYDPEKGREMGYDIFRVINPDFSDSGLYVLVNHVVESVTEEVMPTP
jgi:hypothetical protein